MTEDSGSPHKNAKAEAKAAKAYAKATRPWYMKKRWWLAGLVLVALIASALGGGGDDTVDPVAGDNSSESNDSNADNSDDGSATKEKAKEEKPQVTTVKVQATKILQEFEENEAAADAKYKGKTLEVAGIVDKVDTEVWDNEQYVVRIGGGTDFEIITVNCNDQSSEDVTSIKKGEKLTVIGEFDDGGDLGVELKDCKIK